VAVSADVPYVLTVHDRSWELRPRDFTLYEQFWHRVTRPRALARGAAVVLVTTEHGRADVRAAWGLGDVRVAPLAPAVAPSSAAVSPPAGHSSAGAAPPAGPSPSGDVRGGPYFLFVGALEPRKGPDVLAKAAALARAVGLQARVVVVGEGRVPVPGLELRHGVTDAELSALYAGALAVVVPSRLEGYGLPAVEALAHGTPAIVTDLEPVREVLGDRAHYVPVDDPRSLAHALLEFEQPRRATPVPGLSWDATAAITYEALRDAAR
jgi:glycosyltransferase involved in cell wall biosynthesis